jgi:pSer/pThr/pTyr-binding forkhead associated (FHA) protein
VICVTCGRDNPSHLIFCQECGQRLPQRNAPAAPIIGIGAAGPATDPRPGFEPKPPSIAPQRPPAPEVNFSGREASTEGADGAGGDADMPACPLCGQRNPRSLRFCVTCGHLLAPLSLPPPSIAAPPPAPYGGAPRGAGAPAPSPEGQEPAAQTIRPPAPDAMTTAPIAPGRVVDLGGPQSDAMLRLCPRCRGGSDPSSSFCRFCGASMADGPAISLAPRTPAPPPADAVSVVPSPSTSPRSPVPARPSPPPARSTVAMVSPLSAHAPRARVVLIARDGGEGPSYPLGESSDIGRLEGNILIADDRYVSPRHARIQVRGGAFYLRDLGSTNGIFMRIPFTRELASPGVVSRKDPRAAGATGATGAAGTSPADKPGAGGVGGVGAGNAPGHAALEQPIVDQDLFLAGQQVLKFEVVKNAEDGFGVASDNGTLLFGTPAAPRYGRLSQRTVEGVVRDVYHLQKAETIIGREVGDLVFTEDPFLSRRHAAIVIQGGMTPGARGTRRFTLVDLGSSNGTFLQIREEIRLKNGDHLRIGQQLFRFDLDRPDA